MIDNKLVDKINVFYMWRVDNDDRLKRILKDIMKHLNYEITHYDQE